VKGWLAGLAEGGRQLCSREFWRAFRDYWSGAAIAGRMDTWIERQERHHGRGRGGAEPGPYED
jgi:hypothetical protein